MARPAGLQPGRPSTGLPYRSCGPSGGGSSHLKGRGGEWGNGGLGKAATTSSPHRRPASTDESCIPRSFPATPCPHRSLRATLRRHCSSLFVLWSGPRPLERPRLVSADCHPLPPSQGNSSGSPQVAQLQKGDAPFYPRPSHPPGRWCGPRQSGMAAATTATAARPAAAARSGEALY